MTRQAISNSSTAQSKIQSRAQSVDNTGEYPPENE